MYTMIWAEFWSHTITLQPHAYGKGGQQTVKLKNLRMYWIQTQLHNKQSYWTLQYTLHGMETWQQHTCGTLTDLPYIVAKNTIQVICTTTTKVPNSGFLILSIRFWQRQMTFGLLPSYVLKHNTPPFGDKLGPRVQACLLPKLSLHDD